MRATFRRFLEWGAETFSDRSKTQTTCNMVVIEKVWLFSVAPLFNVAPLEDSLL